MRREKQKRPGVVITKKGTQALSMTVAFTYVRMEGFITVALQGM
jgi:hypothetical protein